MSEADGPSDSSAVTFAALDGQPLPEKRTRNRRGAEEIASVGVDVEVVTPILGGSSQLRTIDDVDIIRPASVRGHLRLWWRALYGHTFDTSNDLSEAESALWGKAAGDDGGRSDVEIRVEIVGEPGDLDDSDIDLRTTPGAYALFPARSERRNNTPTAPRRAPGTTFRLDLRAPKGRVDEVRRTLRAWLLFGGYGGRTRRGLGSFKVTSRAEAWLPREATRQALTEVFGADVFAPLGGCTETPVLAGAALYVARSSSPNAQTAWTTALDWLKAFRQGTGGARQSGAGKPQPNRPSISNWPEADKVRHIREKTTAHPPRHNDTPAWPRAGFGLPIIGQFQKNARSGGRLDEPDGFELRWHDGSGERDRLASPLIVKALPLADGCFVPCALWLNRSYPAGQVVLRGMADSGAPFDRLVAPGDTAQFSALAGKATLRDAFLDWLGSRATRVAP